MKYTIQIGKENIILSTLRDIKTFGIILLSFYLNYKYIGGNNFVDFLLLFMSFLFVSGCFLKRKNYIKIFELQIIRCDTKEEAINFIKEIKE